jgi:hypothetical protein
MFYDAGTGSLVKWRTIESSSVQQLSCVKRIKRYPKRNNDNFIRRFIF